MANVAVDAAIKSLQAIGIPIPSYMDGFIELLVDAGEDVLTAVPHIISVTEQLGTETWSTTRRSGLRHAALWTPGLHTPQDRCGI